MPPALSGAVNGLKYTESCTAAGQDVTCHGELVIDKLVLDAKQYAEFHDAMAKLGAYRRRVVLLTKGYGVTKIGSVTPNGMRPG